MYQTDNDPVINYYDFSLALCSKTEINFFTSYAKESLGPTVDLCCGTGIVSIEIAKNNRKVYSIDSSQQMLSKFIKKIADNNILKFNIEISNQSMNNFSLNEKVNYIFCRDAFFHNLTTKSQRDTLKCIIRNLNPGGKFVFNIHNPNPNFLMFASSDESSNYKLRSQYPIPNTENVLEIYQSLSADLNNQIITTNLKFATIDKNGTRIKEEKSSWQSRYTFPYEMFYLLELSEFKINNVYGNYDKSEYSIDTMLIIEAEKN